MKKQIITIALGFAAGGFLLNAAADVSHVGRNKSFRAQARTSQVGRATASSLPDNHAEMSGAKRRARPTGLEKTQLDSLLLSQFSAPHEHNSEDNCHLNELSQMAVVAYTANVTARVSAGKL